MMYKFLLITIFVVLHQLSLGSAAHFIVGYVEDALDSTSPNGRTVELSNGFGDTLTSTVGPTGPSNTNNVYLFDCEALATPCTLNEVLNVSLLDDGSGYKAKNNASVTVTGAGFDSASNISMNSPPAFINITVDDAIPSPTGEIDLTPANTTTINCIAIVTEYDGVGELINASAQFYSSLSFPGDTNDNNSHYTNNSCEIDTSYGGANEAQINCSLEIEYYANSDNWQCTVGAFDNSSAESNETNATFINPLLSISVDSPIIFGTLDQDTVTSEVSAPVTNVGNVAINLSLNGYGASPGDGNSFECTLGNNISIEETKFNLTLANTSNLTRAQFNTQYTNLTSGPVTYDFNLTNRQNDTEDDAIKDSYWRVYVPIGAAGSCTGNIIFGAAQS